MPGPVSVRVAADARRPRQALPAHQAARRRRHADQTRYILTRPTGTPIGPYRMICARPPAPLTQLPPVPSRRSGAAEDWRTTIVITLSNQQGYVSDTCGQAERKAVRGQASRSPVRFRWADPAVNRHAISCPPTAASRGTRRTGSARLHAPPCADRRAWRRTRAAPTCATARNRPRPDDELAAARTGAAARAVSPGLRRAGRLRAPAPIWSTSTGAIPATTDRTSPH
jgi:hypothetical protein